MDIHYRAHSLFFIRNRVSKSKKLTKAHYLSGRKKIKIQKPILFLLVTITVIFSLTVFDFPHKTHGFVIQEADPEWDIVGVQPWDLEDDAAAEDAYKNAHHKIFTKSVSHKTLDKDEYIESETGYNENSDKLVERQVSEDIPTVSEEFNDHYTSDFLEPRAIKIQNTSDLHNDNHTDGDSEEAGMKKVPEADFLKQVVILQRPFHFHIPILSNVDQVETKEITEETPENSSGDIKRETSEYKTGITDEKMGSLVTPGSAGNELENQMKFLRKRDTQEQQPSPAKSPKDGETQKEIDLEYLLSQHPELIPSVNRKRSPGKGEAQPENLEEEIHHAIMGLRLELEGDEEDDDVVGQGDSQVVVRKRDAKTMKISQNVIDSLLGHEDDLVNYRKKIMKHAKSLGIKPEEAFHNVVYGTASEKSNQENSSTLNDIYQRRLQFHELFLESSQEVQKYHVKEAVDNDKKGGESGPFNAYLKVVKRSKRGLGSWLRKVFHMEKKTTTTTTTTTTAPPPPRKRQDNQRKKAGGKKPNNVYTPEVDANGDTEVDRLLPKALRRSTYLKRKDQIKDLEEEEKEFEDEYEESEEKEVKTRGAPDGDQDYEEEYEDQDKLTFMMKNSKRRDKRSVTDPVLERRQISVLSKDELSLVLEMIFNLVEYRCTNVKNYLMDELLSITQTIVDLSSLEDYISERRSEVDLLFEQMLECSSNSKTISNWAHYQLWKRQQISSSEGPGRNVLPQAMNVYEKPLRRSKRVRKELSAVELISLDKSLPQRPPVRAADEEETKNDQNNFDSVLLQLKKLYILVYHIISDTCFNVDSQLLHEPLSIFIKEMAKLKQNEDFQEEMDNFMGHFDTSMVDNLLTKCYEAEVF